MDIPGIGKDFDWWHALVGVSGAALVACIAKGWSDGAILASGSGLIGLGYWINMPLHTRFIHGGIASGKRWHPYFTGFQFIAVGYAVIGFGLYRLF